MLLKKIALALLFTFQTIVAFAQGGQVRGITLTNRLEYSKIMSGAQVAMYACPGASTVQCPDISTLTPLHLYQNQNLTTLVPHTTYVLSDDNGNYQFWITPGQYNLCVSGAQFVTLCQMTNVGPGSAAAQVYPPAGIPNSTGSAWVNPSYTPFGTATPGQNVQLELGSVSAGDCPTWDSSHNLIDGGPPPCGGGGGTPAPPDTSVQFNNSGSFGGSANFTWDGTQAIVGVTNLQSFVGQGYFNVSQNQPFASIVEPFSIQLSYNDGAGGPAAPSLSTTTTSIDQYGQIKTRNSGIGGTGGFISPGGGGFQEFRQDAGASPATAWDALADVNGDSQTLIGVRGQTDDTNNTHLNAGAYGGYFNVLNTKTSTDQQVAVFAGVNTTASTSPANLIGVLSQTPVGSPAFFSSGGYMQLSESTFSAIGTCGGAGGPQAGAIMAISDSTTVTWGATITGLGTNHVLAYCDGTNWTVMAK